LQCSSFLCVKLCRFLPCLFCIATALPRGFTGPSSRPSLHLPCNHVAGAIGFSVFSSHNQDIQWYLSLEMPNFSCTETFSRVVSSAILYLLAPSNTLSHAHTRTHFHADSFMLTHACCDCCGCCLADDVEHDDNGHGTGAGSGAAAYALTFALPHFVRPSPNLPPAVFIQRFFTFFLLNSAFIPVSLYVTMKVARQFQKLFIELDNNMVHVDKALLQKTNGAEGEFRMKVRVAGNRSCLGLVYCRKRAVLCPPR
jgi:hypothetical protein